MYTYRKVSRKPAVLIAAACVILVMIVPDIVRCVINGKRSGNFSDMYRINYVLETALEKEIESGVDTWHRLVEENDSEKLLNEVSVRLMNNRIKPSDFYAESDGHILKISSVKYPELQTLKMKIPEIE